MTADVVSPLLSDVRPLVPRPRPPIDGVPAWVKDPNTIQSIRDGFYPLDADLLGGA